MDQSPPKHKSRLLVSDAIVHSCRAYTQHDMDLAFRWAVKALQRVDDGYLNPEEERYLETVLRESQN